jgi:hypothetical protein
MTLKYKVDNDDLYRQYARFTSDYVQNIRDNNQGSYNDGLSYADTIKIDVLEYEHTYEVLKDITEIFINMDVEDTICYLDCGMFDVELTLSHNYDELSEVLDTLDSALIKYDFKIKDCYGRMFNYSSVFNVKMDK